MFPFTLQQLRILKAIAQEKNFTKAADLIYLSQPSLSKQIKTLEKNLNLILITRENNKISLTENGRIFLYYSEKILALSEECCRALFDLKNGEQDNNLTIGASESIGIYIIPKVINIFTKMHPRVDLKVKIDSTQIVAKNVINRKVDIGIVGGEISEKLKKHLTVESFADEEINLIVSKFHPFVSKSIITKEDLYTLNFISLNSNSTIKRLIDQTLVQNQIEIKQLKTILQFNSVEGIKTAVSLGLGAAFVSSSAIEKEIKLKTIKIIKIENIKITRSLSILINPDFSQTKVVKSFYIQLSKLKNNF
jgi:DNA-binding transcriptional LysR family regulator